MNNSPLVSVLITSYNREKYIKEAIESVITQSYTNIEVIIIDDCSIDKTWEIIKSYEFKDDRIQIFQNKINLGQFANRNIAASKASGKYIKYVDSDDLIYPDTLNYMVKNMEDHPETGMGFCMLLNNENYNFPIIFKSKEVIKEHFLNGKTIFVGPSGCIYKKDIFLALNKFEDYGMPSDSHLNLKIACKYPTIAFPKNLFLWREHQEQTFQINKNNYFNIVNNYNYTMDIIKNYSPLNKIENNRIKKNIRKNFIKHIYRLIINKKPITAFKLILSLSLRK